MPIFKNEDNGTWYVMARYTDWKGERKQKCKRGFATKREAQEWERTFQQQTTADMDMSFEAFVELYSKDIKSRLKESTWQTKENIINTKILPYFGKRKISEITTKDVIAWQNELLAYRDEKKKPFSQTYLKTLHNQLSAIFNHAVRFYDLRSNPASKAGNMGSEERKEIRADRRIENYYEKIRNSKQEKLFHELILQIGDKENMSAESENGQLARQILDEYFRGFQERNPNLKVFSAHLHMDEATPHLHIDFVPFTTGSKRGLDTRVSLKQALAAQGFKGGTRGDTEWSQWVQAEKEQLATVMERYGIMWEHKGTHEKHLSVLDYKKQVREKEVKLLDDKLAEKKDEFEAYRNRIQNYDNGTQVIEELKQKLDTDAEYQLPEPPALMSAKSYKMKFVEPLIRKLKEVISEVFYRYYQALDAYHRLNITNANLYRENEKLTKINDKLAYENENLRAENRDYKLLRKVFGNKQIDDLLERARSEKRSKQREKRSKNKDFER